MGKLLNFNSRTNRTAKLTLHERDSALKRLAQISVAIGHPQRTPEQIEALHRERAELEQTLAADESCKSLA